MSGDLDRSDFQSKTWKRVEQRLQARLDVLRKANDDLSLDPTKTAALRGKIAEVKRMMGWASVTSTDDAPDAAALLDP